ncbi:MAG TPA: hypothetical protein VED01_03275 [Burkholderiales bacterium]|nr:hypothetical protein [Burkholderiales bacterium]
MSNHLVGTVAELVEQRDAIGRARGFPRRRRRWRRNLITGVLENVTGDPRYDNGSPIYLGRGTPGWSDYDPEIVVSDDGTVAAFALSAKAEEQLGKAVQMADGRSVLVKARADIVQDTALPQKVREVLERRRGAAAGLELPIDITRVGGR